jgi:hypothetical protein
MRFPALCVAALLVLLNGCNCGGGGGGTNQCGESNAVLGALCDVIDRCPDKLPYPIAYRSHQECIDILCFSLTCRLKTDRVNSTNVFTITQTLPTVDSSKVQACSTWLKSASCDFWSSSTPAPAGNPCEGVVNFFPDSSSSSDDKKLHETCSGSCATGLYCTESRYVADAGLKSCRTCEAKPVSGEVCSGSAQCVTAAFCQYPNDGGPNRCQTKYADGIACTYSEECVSEFCNQNTKKCDPLGKPGSACTVAMDCRTGYCDATQKCATYKPNGSSCATGDECSYKLCSDAGICGLADGTPCNGSSNCASSFCDPNTNPDVCVARKAAGTACTNSDECVTNYCDFNSKLCIERCNSDSECDAGTKCSFSSNRCEGPKANGASCRSDDECASGSCNDSTDRCGNLNPAGGTCTNGDTCTLDAICTNGTCVKKFAPGAKCSGLESCIAPFICIKETCQLMNLACRPGKTGEICAFLRVCDEASYCDMGDGFTCKGRSPAGSTCTSNDGCASGTWCDSSSGMGKCVATKADGAACASSGECSPGSGCVAGDGGLACAKTLPIQACGDSDDPPCPSGTYCGTRDICLALPKLGESCSNSDSKCASPLFCNSSYRCATRLEADAGCNGYRDFECVDGYYCNTSAGSPYHCVTSPGAGEPCDSRVTCQPNLYCANSSGKCETKLENGKSCSGNLSCMSGVCDYSVGCLAGNACLPP